MNDWRARIQTPWTGSGAAGDAYRPLVVVAYSLGDWSGVTGGEPPNSVLIIQADPITADKLQAIGLDNRFTVLWQEEIIPEQ